MTWQKKNVPIDHMGLHIKYKIAWFSFRQAPVCPVPMYKARRDAAGRCYRMAKKGACTVNIIKLHVAPASTFFKAGRKTRGEYKSSSECETPHSIKGAYRYGGWSIKDLFKGVISNLDIFRFAWSHQARYLGRRTHATHKKWGSLGTHRLHSVIPGMVGVGHVVIWQEPTFPTNISVCVSVFPYPYRHY